MDRTELKRTAPAADAVDREMGSTDQDPSRLAGPPAGHSPPPVETLQDALGELLREREELRATGAERADLERNRRAIVGVQWQISRALIARHHPGFQAA